MNVTKEQIFFLVVLAVLGWMSYSRITDKYQMAVRPRGKPLPAVERRGVPLTLAASSEHNRLVQRGRDIYAQPRDWAPLEAIDLELPPLVQPPFVPPFPAPYLGVDEWMKYARTEPKIPTEMA